MKFKPSIYSALGAINKRSINAALRKEGLPVEIQNNRDGYSYFTSTVDGGSQVGDSVMVCYLCQLPISKWVEEARNAIAQDEKRRVRGY